LVRDEDGNFYGTAYGGITGGTCGSTGCGVVFKLSARGHLTVLHSFTGGADGSKPLALIRSPEDNLYGTTATGGGTGCNNNGLSGCGVVFKLSANGKFTVLYSFLGGSDGAAPTEGALLRDRSGNLYGSTFYGGGQCDAYFAGCGTVFRIDPDGRETILFSFTHFGEGVNPQGPLLRDRSGNLYGTTMRGGLQGAACDNGCGVVSKIDRSGKETPLHSFTGAADGASPMSGVIRDRLGNFYGVTAQGGTACDRYGDTCGVVFKLDKAGNETVLYTFTDGSDGGFPAAGLRRDKQGNLYGTTSDGGESGSVCLTGCGVIFKITP
jgi:uncharacterized repeat protein (TIGR03803 family)